MNKRAPSFPVVGIGASAGGVQALELFFDTAPPDSGMAFVVVTHLPAGRKSLLGEILARHTQMPVRDAREGVAVAPNHVYVGPPGVILTMEDGRFQIRQAEDVHRKLALIDVFLSSLSRDCGDQAVGIILSGSGADGALGVKAIKDAGGLTLAQAPDSTGPGFPGMPESAIATGLVDFAVPVTEMGAKLVTHARALERLDAAAEAEMKQALESVFAVLRNGTGHDFTGYKTRNFMRRLHRRMDIQQCETVSDYVQRLRESPDEVTLLFRDLLINVTSFFRDSGAFEALKEQVVPRLFEGKAGPDSVRIWAPGCSTGEEAYSVGMLLLEYVETLPRPHPNIAIFATDIDEQALTAARGGRYPAALMENVSPERRQKFFTVDEAGSFVVNKPLRELCVFATHNTLRDPPFSRMDLISCRNLLIYFGAEAQRRVLPLFHYALRPGGFLFLGMSETIGRFTELFTPLDKRHCLFKAREAARQARRLFLPEGLPPPPFAIPGAGRTVKPEARLRQAVASCIIEKFAPPYVVVDEDGDIVFSSPRTGRYLELSPGAPTRQLLAMARKDLRLDLRGALREATETRRAAMRENIKMGTENGQERHVTLTVDPILRQNDGNPLFAVIFTEPGAAPAGEANARVEETQNGAAQLEGELRETRERLQTTIEEYETALEQLKSSNEELLSLNEETQSSNEELESSKEELQSVNEALQTVNYELYTKLQELDRAHSDLNNLFASTQIATVFLDHNLVIRNFTPAAAKLFNIIQTDAGRPLTDLAVKLHYPEFQADIEKVLARGEQIERRVASDDADADADARRYLARLTPYRNSSQGIDGVVATFIDITTLAHSERQLQQLHDFRLNAMKGMATGLAHEINQPLAATANYLQTARRLLQTPPEQRRANVEQMLTNANEQVMRAGRIIMQLREIAARSEPDKTLHSVHDLIRDVCASKRVEAEQAKVAVALQLNAREDSALMDEAQIKLVLNNLLRNAIEAMSGLEKRELTISTSNVDGDAIRIDVADTGCGLSEEIKASLFEPFPSGKLHGMGIGLSICQLIVEGHDAKIWAEARPEGGAIFSFTLPLVRVKQAG